MKANSKKEIKSIKSELQKIKNNNTLLLTHLKSLRLSNSVTVTCTDKEYTIPRLQYNYSANRL
jgi:hypothetical protein